MKKNILRIMGMCILTLGLFFVTQTEVLGNIFEGLNIITGDEDSKGKMDTSLVLTDGNIEEDLPEIEVPDTVGLTQKAQGTIVAIHNDEYLFIQKLDLSDTELNKTVEEWLTSEYITDLMRLTAIETELEIGTEIEISFGIATFSIPPVVPVQSYKIIA